jgi:hypothetical protein
MIKKEKVHLEKTIGRLVRNQRPSQREPKARKGRKAKLEQHAMNIMEIGMGWLLLMLKKVIF